MVQQSQSSPFVNAMDKATETTTCSASDRRRGENGASEYTARGVEESRVALFFALVRDLPKERFRELFQLVMADADASSRDGDGDQDQDQDQHQHQPQIVADLFLLAFQTRNCRGGKGEKDLFYRMIMELSAHYPRTVESLMGLVPHYGSFRDWFKLVSLAKHDDTEERIQIAMVPVVNAIMDLAAEQLLRDKQAMEEMTLLKSQSHSQSQSSGKGKKKTMMISLLAKWAPREKKQFGNQVRILANKLFPDSRAPKKEYRQLLSKLNRAIQTVEVSMSANRFDAINPVHIPSCSMMKHRKAFLNEKVGGPPPYGDEVETGNRHPDNASRVECRKRLRRAMQDDVVKKLKGRQLFPHEIVQKIAHGRGNRLSEAELDIFQCQWKDILENVKTAMEAVKARNENREQEHLGLGLDGVEQEKKEEEGAGCSIDLGKIVPLVDVSGSMHGIPMDVAVALGILVSEVASPEFANRCVTFHESPSWVQFDSGMSLFEKVQKLRSAPWGMNTDFEKATEMILEVAVQAKLEPEDIPDLIVFSDMQFDEARDSRYNEVGWETHHERIVRRFKEEGLRVCGKEWPAPHIVYWNLRGNTDGFPAQGDTPNVTMLSGFSPSLLKLLLNGDPIMTAEEEEEGDDMVVLGEGGKTKTKRNPYSIVRKALDDEDYNLVRRVLNESMEGLLKFYVVPDDAMADPEEEVGRNEGEEMDETSGDGGDWEMVK